jgi:hypothetical protein
MKFRQYILGPGLDEASYRGNIGFEEMTRFYKKANPKQIKQMEKILDSSDWDAFVQLIQQVLGTRLKKS